MMRLFDWKARRAGAAISITGKDSGGATAKITRVVVIAPQGGRLFATDQDGEAHELVLS